MGETVIGKVVLGIDDPQLTTRTEFYPSRRAEEPQRKDPTFADWEGGMLRTHIVVKPPAEGRRIVASIHSAWSEGMQAWARQNLPGQDTVDMRIIGITVVCDDEQNVVFRLYTPPELVSFDEEQPLE